LFTSRTFIFIFSKKKLKKKAGIFGRAAPHRKGSGGTKIKTAENPLDKVHCKKRLSIFPSPAGMSLTKLSMGGNN
jgi:hypothetical protein